MKNRGSNRVQLVTEARWSGGCCGPRPSEQASHQEASSRNSQNTIHVLTVSGACCSPGLAKQDQILEANLQKAIDSLSVPVDVRTVGLSAVLGGGGDITSKQRGQIQALFQRYGAKFTPALFINDEVRFAGDQPTLEQLTEALLGAASPHSEF